MLTLLFDFLKSIDNVLWGYLDFILIVVLGSYLTFKGAFFQIRQIPSIIKSFFSLIGKSSKGARGTHPLQVFFASVGGMIGVGNIVAVCTAIQLGGPGALLWVWVTGIIGAVVKYSEIYLGHKYRVPNANGGYDGGPMYFLKAAFKSKFLPIVVAVLLCIYGIEIYTFSVITESVSTNWNINHTLVTLVLLALVLYASIGGVKRIGKICSWIMPLFLVTYIAMGLWILISEANLLPSILANVFTSAFSGHAAVGGFVGSTAIMAIQNGMGRAAYSADIGIGYDSIIQSESSTPYPQRQARLAILGVLIDNLICTLSILLVLISGLWKTNEIIPGSALVQTALGNYFPYMNFFIPLFLAIVGYTTIIAYFCVGIKCAHYLIPKGGKTLYIFFGALSLFFSSFISQTQTLVVMSVAGALLLVINLSGIFKLRHQISFVVPKEYESYVVDIEKSTSSRVTNN